MSTHWRRKMLFSMLIMAILFATCTAAAQDSPRDAIELYFQAHAFGNGDYIQRAFSPDAKIQFVDNGELKQWTREEFAQRFRGPAEDEHRRVRRVERLDITGNAASAVLTLDYPQVLFTDHVSLLKINNQWKIVNKVFQLIIGMLQRKISKTHLRTDRSPLSRGRSLEMSTTSERT